MNKRVLITGAFGLLGGRLAQHLATQDEYDIILGTRKKKPACDWLVDAEIVQTQWNSQFALSQICQDVDLIIHLAGMNSKDCVIDPVAAWQANAVATANIVQAAIEQKIRRFIYVSTAHVYRNPLVGTITESTCLNTIHPYASTNRAGEDIVRYVQETGEMEGVVVRLSNSFGAPVNPLINCWMLLVNDLCRQAIVRKKMILRTAGLQSRDFIAISDVCRAIQHIIKTPISKLNNGLLNLGRGSSRTVWAMASLIQQRCLETLGFLPELERSLPQINEAPQELKYCVDILRSSGFEFSIDEVNEIDQLLKFCHERVGCDE
ncbi:MAG: SDR family oxidoreductase [Gammaproteobacteria bacterium]|nr:SDR family oxidoreductase [Gammaproteobacteria bacterium]